MAPSYVHSNDIVADLKDATHGYDYVFNDDIIKAREIRRCFCLLYALLAVVF